jgi:hypothetical protein
MAPRLGIRILVASLIIGVALAPSGLAARSPTRQEADAIARVFGKVPAGCLTIRVSTYALTEFESRPPKSCDRYAFNGVSLLKRHDERWKVLFEASCCYRCPQVPAPAAVKRDLRFPGCVSAATRREATKAPGSDTSRRPSLQAPATAAIGSRITIRANHLDGGRYTLVLAIVTRVVNDMVTSCFGRVGSSQTAVAGSVAITGTLPERLACYQGTLVKMGYFKVRPDRYVLSLGVFRPPAAFADDRSFVKRGIRLTD